MDWIQPLYSRGEVDRAGKKLAVTGWVGSGRGEPDTRHELAVLNKLACGAQLSAQHDADGATAAGEEHRARRHRLPAPEAGPGYDRQVAAVPRHEVVADAGHRWLSCHPRQPCGGSGTVECAPSLEDEAPTHPRGGLHPVAQAVRLPRRSPRVPLSKRQERHIQRAPDRDTGSLEAPTRLGDRCRDGRSHQGLGSQVQRGECGLAAVLRSGRVLARDQGALARGSGNPFRSGRAT